MAELTAAEAWCWAAHLYGREADAIDYAWPKQPDAHERSCELNAIAKALHDRAAELDSSKTLWKRAIAKWLHPRCEKPARKPTRRRGTKPTEVSR
jgi:hypothetical protein